MGLADLLLGAHGRIATRVLVRESGISPARAACSE